MIIGGDICLSYWSLDVQNEILSRRGHQMLLLGSLWEFSLVDGVDLLSIGGHHLLL
jgi:hypothetical protein